MGATGQSSGGGDYAGNSLAFGDAHAAGDAADCVVASFRCSPEWVWNPRKKALLPDLQEPEHLPEASPWAKARVYFQPRMTLVLTSGEARARLQMSRVPRFPHGPLQSGTRGWRPSRVETLGSRHVPRGRRMGRWQFPQPLAPGMRAPPWRAAHAPVLLNLRRYQTVPVMRHPGLLIWNESPSVSRLVFLQV